MKSDDEVNGKDTIAVVSVGELNDVVARYRTALVALVDMIKREGGYRPHGDLQLVRQIERMLDEDSRTGRS